MRSVAARSAAMGGALVISRERKRMREKEVVGRNRDDRGIGGGGGSGRDAFCWVLRRLIEAFILVAYDAFLFFFCFLDFFWFMSSFKFGLISFLFIKPIFVCILYVYKIHVFFYILVFYEG